MWRMQKEEQPTQLLDGENAKHPNKKAAAWDATLRSDSGTINLGVIKYQLAVDIHKS